MTHIPRHIGFILDGNRRWAREHGLPTYEGHLAGLNALQDVLRASVDAVASAFRPKPVLVYASGQPARKSA